MQPSDSKRFKALMKGVHDFYGKDLSEFALSVWWQAMRPFDYEAVADGLNRHCVNPDAGQFLPKPADVVKMLNGRTVDGAQVAWSKVDRAVRHVGTYATVVFDDPLIHRVITDMGGWTLLGMKSDDEWPFVAREFENRYRGYSMRSETPEYPPKLTGQAEASNAQNGFRSQPPVLLGDPERARSVFRTGGEHAPLRISRAEPAPNDPPTAPALRQVGE